MNTGVVILALLLAAGAVLVIVEAAASQPVDYTDTYGTTYSAATSHTQGIIQNQTAPLTQFGGGAVILLAFFVIIIAAAGAWAATRHGSGQYSSRHG